MADEVEIAKNSLDVLNEVFELGSTFDDLSHIIKLSGPLASAIPFVGAILGLIRGLLPGDNHKEIIGRFNQLGHKIDLVRNDITDLNQTILWGMTELQFGAAVNRIDIGIKYCLKIGKASEEDERKRYRKRVVELCAHENCHIALKTILDGISGYGLAERRSILDQFYDKTEGHRPKISALATRLLQLAYGGMMVVSTYETIIHGKEGAADVKELFQCQLNEATDKVDFVLDRCVSLNEFRTNMRNDLNAFLDKGGSNKDLVTEISNFMSDKYDWLENHCLVYDDLHGFDKHSIDGYDYVHSFHRNEKCGVVFYQEKILGRVYGEHLEAHYNGLISEARRAHAQNGHTGLRAMFGKYVLNWFGSAVITGYPDLRVRGTFSSKVIHMAMGATTAIILPY